MCHKVRKKSPNEEKFEDTKEVISIRKLKMCKQYNGKKKNGHKDKQ